MARFLLVHGSCHGAWCWRDLIPALAALGHDARAIDLPGHGDDTTPLADQTLERCRDAVLAASTPESILVGHSWGGYPIGLAAETAPQAMRGLVFLCAYVPADGQSMVDRARAAARQPLKGALNRGDDGATYSFKPEAAPAELYHDCSAEARDFALAHLGPQATRPQTTPAAITDRFASVSKAYIRCTDDRTIPPEYQAEMCRNWPEGTVHTMPTSHSPFLSDPAGLAGVLDRIERTL